MGRRSKNESLIRVLYAVFMRIPVWMCIPTAVFAFFVASGVIAGIANRDQRFASFASLGNLAGGGLAAIILLAGFKAFVERIARERLLAKQTGIESVRSLSWSQFELLIGQVYRQKGYEVIETGGGGPDGGIDLKLRKDGLTTIVQCKQWKSWKVGVGPIRELYGVLMASSAERAVFVTSGVFTKDAWAFTAGKPLELVDGIALGDLFRSIENSPAAETSSHQGFIKAAGPVCPQCSGVMILRTARKGTHAGSQFWGCSAFPRCKGTRAIEAVVT